MQKSRTKSIKKSTRYCSIMIHKAAPACGIFSIKPFNTTWLTMHSSLGKLKLK